MEGFSRCLRFFWRHIFKAQPLPGCRKPLKEVAVKLLLDTAGCHLRLLIVGAATALGIRKLNFNP